jgi:hypothetical protein
VLVERNNIRIVPSTHMGPTLCNPVLESRIAEQNTWRIECTRLRPGLLECQRNSSCIINEDSGCGKARSIRRCPILADIHTECETKDLKKGCMNGSKNMQRLKYPMCTNSQEKGPHCSTNIGLPINLQVFSWSAKYLNRRNQPKCNCDSSRA